nr:hypothetical protein [Tanacetum cinerariifolium]
MRSKSSGLKRLRKVGTYQRVESFIETVLGTELQGRTDDVSVAKEVSAAEPTVFDDEEVTMTMDHTLIKMKAEKVRLLDEQMAKRLHDEEVEQATAREKQEKDDLEKAKVRPIFERKYNKVQTLFKPNNDVEEPTMKRVAEETLHQESFKKLKAVEVSGSHSIQDTLTHDPKEISKEDVKNMLEIVLVSEFKFEALQVNAHKSCLDSRIQLNSTLAHIDDQVTSITSLCELACQFVQKKLEEKQLEEEQAAKAQTWKPPVCCDDDDDEESSNSLNDNISELPLYSAITPDEPVLSTEEPDNPLSMGDEHIGTILATESDQLIKSGVENLIPIPNESEGIPEHVCDVPSIDNSPPLDASPPDSELVSSEVMEIVIPEVGGIKASNDNPIPSYDPSISGTPPNLTPSGESEFFSEETNNFHNSLPEGTTFLHVLCDAECESDSSDDQSCSDEYVLEIIGSKPLYEEEIIPMESLRTHDSSLPIS